MESVAQNGAGRQTMHVTCLAGCTAFIPCCWGLHSKLQKNRLEDISASAPPDISNLATATLTNADEKTDHCSHECVPIFHSTSQLSRCNQLDQKSCPDEVVVAGTRSQESSTCQAITDDISYADGEKDEILPREAEHDAVQNDREATIDQDAETHVGGFSAEEVEIVEKDADVGFADRELERIDLSPRAACFTEPSDWQDGRSMELDKAPSLWNDFAKRELSDKIPRVSPYWENERPSLEDVDHGADLFAENSFVDTVDENGLRSCGTPAQKMDAVTENVVVVASDVSDLKEVRILNLAGEVLTTLQCSHDWDFSQLQKTVGEACGVVRFRVKLLHPTQGTLGDSTPVSSLTSDEDDLNRISLQLVRLSFEPSRGLELIQWASHGTVQDAEHALFRLADPNYHATGTTPLLSAARYGQYSIAKLLCEAGAECNTAIGENGMTPLLTAARQGHAAIVQGLMKAKADSDKSSSNMATPLFLAAQEGHLDTVRCLCEGGVDQNKAARDGTTPLLAALQRCHVEVARYLCQAGAAMEKPREDGATPLLVASWHGHVEMVQCLCNAHACPNTSWRSGATALMNAALEGNLEVAQLLCHARALVDSARCDGATPLFVAAEQGFRNVAACLCEAGADKEKARQDGATPLFIASRLGRLEVVCLLCQRGANPMTTTVGGSLPVSTAVEHNHMDVVRYLCEIRVDCNASRQGGVSPFLLAAQHGHIVLVQYMCGKSAAVNLQAHDGTTPLLVAAQKGHLEVLKCLLHNRASVHKSAKVGTTVMTAAMKYGHTEVATFLRNREEEQRSLFQSGLGSPLTCSHWCRPFATQ